MITKQANLHRCGDPEADLARVGVRGSAIWRHWVREHAERLGPGRRPRGLDPERRMKAGLLAIVFALVASPLAGQRLVHARIGVSVPAEQPLGFVDGFFAGGVYLDIPHEGEAVEGTVHIVVRAFRIGVLWAEQEAYIPAMILFGEQVFLAVGGAPGLGDGSFTLSMIAGVGFTASVPRRPDISWGAEVLYMHEVTSRQPSGLLAGQVVFTAGIGFRP